jgi:hypothetical protein
LRRIFENPGDNRRSAYNPRRRPNNGRTQDDDQAQDLRPALMRPVPPAFAPPATTAEFWTLLGAAAPDAGAKEKQGVPMAQRVPTVLELLDQVIASH